MSATIATLDNACLGRSAAAERAERARRLREGDERRSYQSVRDLPPFFGDHDLRHPPRRRRARLRRFAGGDSSLAGEARSLRRRNGGGRQLEPRESGPSHSGTRAMIAGDGGDERADGDWPAVPRPLNISIHETEYER